MANYKTYIPVSGLTAYPLDISGLCTQLEADVNGQVFPRLISLESQLSITQAERDKLADIAENATIDQTNAEIKIAYEANTDTNAFTNFEQAKLAGIAESATINQTDAEIKISYEANLNTNAYNDAAVLKLANIEDSATIDQTGAEIAVAYEAEPGTKLSTIEYNATADQSPNEIKIAYESNVNTNALTDANAAKLNAIVGWTSGAITYTTAAQLIVFAHGQGAKLPVSLAVYATCLSADAGYAIGDVMTVLPININESDAGNANSQGVVVYFENVADANIRIRFTQLSPRIINKSGSSASATMQLNSWSIWVKALFM